MKHQLIGLRDVFSHGQVRKRDVFFDQAYLADNLSDFFTKTSDVLATLPQEEWTNLYFTVAKSGGKREFLQQDHIPFDIDHIDVTKIEETIRVATGAIGMPFEHCLSMFSGHGVQFYVELTEPFTDPNFIENNKKFYKACCDQINGALSAAGLPGKADTVVWSLARIMRMPGTWNEKPDLPKVMTHVVNNTSVPVPFDLKKASGIPILELKEQIAKWPSPDVNAVLEGCENLKLMLSEPEAVSEVLWYANASIMFHLHVGDATEARKRWHQYSSVYSKYNPNEADRKFDQAGAASGPRTCKNFSTLPGAKCSECKYNGKLKSPILITGPDHIATKETGFHTVTQGIDGTPTMGKPAYEDLVKWFDRIHQFVTHAAKEEVYAFTGTHYEKLFPSEVEGFADKWFTDCSTNKSREFKNRVLRKKLRNPKWWADTTESRLNFQNGVLQTQTMEFKESNSKEHGFMFTLPYSYDPSAKAPRFEQFLKEVTGDSEELIQTLLEFGGYALSNDRYWEHKALVLLGGGDNGKSVYLSTLKAVAENSFSSVNIRDLSNPQTCSNLEGSLFNVANETSLVGFRETDIFKAVTSGEEIIIKNLYEQPYHIKSRAKMLISANNLPTSADESFGFLRRMAIVPFRIQIAEEKKDRDLSEKLKLERAGILNMYMEAYARMKKRGKLIEAKAGKQELDRYKKDSNPILMWVEESLSIFPKENPGAPEEAFSDIYSNYVQYCTSNGFKEKSSVGLGMSLRAYISDYDGRSITRWDSAKKATIRKLTGIKLGRSEENF